MNACLRNNAVFTPKRGMLITESSCSGDGQISVKTDLELGNRANFRVILLFQKARGSAWALVEAFKDGELY